MFGSLWHFRVEIVNEILTLTFEKVLKIIRTKMFRVGGGMEVQLYEKNFHAGNVRSF